MKKLGIVLAFCGVLIGAVVVSLSQFGALVRAEETAPALTPQAWYEFNDADDMGKDSMGNNHLRMQSTGTSATAEIIDEGGDSYLSLARASKSNGKGLYAPKIADGADFSDLIKHSFSVEITFRSAVAGNSDGDHYLMTVGSFFDSLSIRQWNGKIDVVAGNRAFAPEGTGVPGESGYVAWRTQYTVSASYEMNEWATVLVSADQDNRRVDVYVNGAAQGRIEDIDVRMTYQSTYAFAIGMQSSFTGSNTLNYATADIKDCKVFDYALTAENAETLYQSGAAAADGMTYVSSVEALELPEFLAVTDVKTPEYQIQAAQLTDKVAVVLSNGITTQAAVTWYKMPAVNALRGYIHSRFPNVNAFDYRIDLVPTIDFEYEPDLAAITDIKLDGADFVPGTAIDNTLHICSFKVAPVGGASIDSVKWDRDTVLEPDSGGTYEILTNRPVTVVISATPKKYKVTYYNGETLLGNSFYTKNGSEPLLSFEVEGYTFEGWYSDRALTVKVSAPDYQNAADMTLYGKYIKKLGNGMILYLTIGLIGGGLVLGGGAAAIVLISLRKKRMAK
ncbi:MAG: InlB B-repeat-containing protein [Clostridiales bacterium]|jgi:uncharacterized repeat protein (TIGR02543 family)|nr:InlB B-repeat-containing protein [Clostridiales bacterium]